MIDRRVIPWLALALCGCADAVEPPTDEADAARPMDAATVDQGPGDAASGPDAARPGDCGEETCDGFDRDCDGRVDEGCPCAGSTACYGGPPATRGVGACTDGARACDVTGEFWDVCRYWTGPADEVCGDTLDTDCDGRVDETCAPVDEMCRNGVDDDLDGQVDENCVGCDGPEICENDEDDDCDGAIDEACDPGCLEDEICANAADDDCDDRIDEGCIEECGADVSRACFPAPSALIGVGACRAGVQRCLPDFMWGECEGAVPPQEDVCGDGVDSDCDGAIDEGCQMCGEEICANGIDDDCDGVVDDGCGECEPGATAPCVGGPRDGVGVCAGGTRTCRPERRWGPCEGAVTPGAEVCGNGLDEDCDGADAECGPTEVPILLLGDCLTVACPPATPFPVGCQVFFSPGDDRGCVASRPDRSTVYFQAGDQCNAGFITGVLRCAEEPGDPLGPFNCPINKPVPLYPPDRSGCPATRD